MISALHIAKTLIRTKLLISVDFENCGNLTFILRRLLFRHTSF
ncbi:hypothetical protein E2C01_046718 [Portunus trituberculatus]|uniref:Uncharacterized protein n=1 Tax=Portunus trituberculatus TaxID=210409 RepID=A0A5B7G5K5_PORTR|nr:hypothetical protein [Portunus trituberculatus]